MDASRARTIRRGLTAAAALAVLWAGLVALTGGFSMDTAGVHLSARNIRNPLLAALLFLGAALALGPSRRALHDDVLWWRTVAQRARDAVARRRPTSWLDAPAAAAIFGSTVLLLDWARARPLWLDEEMIALNLRDRSLTELAGALWLGQSAPLGWLAGERAVLLLAGSGERALRLIPVAFAMATLAAAVWVGRRWLGTVAATTFVLLLALGRWVYYYALELKHYSADVFFGLLLPALVAWVAEGDRPDLRLRRAGIWWCVAAAGLWLGNGAMFVTPACALVLGGVLWRRDGPRSGLVFAAPAVLWLLSAGVHYVAALQPALRSEFLAQAWSFALPPASAGIMERVLWTVGQAAPLSARPGGTDLAILFWAGALGGMLVGRPRVLTLALAACVLTAPLLAIVRVVPLFERLSLWTVPALYLGIALSIDAMVRAAGQASTARRFGRLAAALTVLALVLRLSADIAAGGWREVVDLPRRVSNHQLDDRAGVRWLLAQRQPGDAVVTTTLGLPAVWWYGAVPLAAPAAGSLLEGGSPLLEVSYKPPGGCDRTLLAAALAPHRRTLVYFGFRFDDVPPGFDELLIAELARIGRVAASRSFADLSRAVVVEIGRPAAAPPDRPPLDGCLSARPAARW